jgi:RNA polymerase sigma-70 factor (ECF subfamily)
MAEELVQETLLAALHNRSTFDHRSSVRTWLVGILKHKIADHFRSSSSRTAASKLDEESFAGRVENQFTRSGKWKEKPQPWRRIPSAPIPEHEQQELRDALLKCMEQLPEQAADVFLASERTSGTSEILSKTFGLSTTNIGVILHRARLALRRCLELRWFGLQRASRS